MSGQRQRTDFTENLEAVAHGVRGLEEIHDPILREAVATALRLRMRELRLNAASRARMRNTVLRNLPPARPTMADRAYGFFALIGMPAPLLVRGLAILVLLAGLLGGATAASADSLPDEPLYGLKLAGEQLRLAIAVSPGDRASVELSMAEHRLDEAERLAASGYEDAAIEATASYGSSLADAAADLATIESTDPRTAALVQQLQSTFTASQQRVATTATRLAADPRTAGTAQVLASVAATAAPSKHSPATQIADHAVAITSRLAVVATARAHGEELRVETARPGATARPAAAATVAVGPTANPSRPAAAAATDDEDGDTAADARSGASAAPIDLASARASAEHAREAAARARQAVEKAKHAASRTPAPSPPRR